MRLRLLRICDPLVSFFTRQLLSDRRNIALFDRLSSIFRLGEFSQANHAREAADNSKNINELE